MDIRKKTLVSVLATFFLTLAIIISSIINAQTTSHYGDEVGDSGANLVGFDLTIYNPISQKVYANTMPLDFKIHWNPVGLLFYENTKRYGLYAYKIDNNPSVSLPSNQKSNSSKDFISNPSFSSIIDISNLNDGQHQLVIIADMEWNPFGGGTTSVCNQTSAPLLFSVQNSTASTSPSPSVPEFSWLMILPLFVLMSIIRIILGTRKRTLGKRLEEKKAHVAGNNIEKNCL
jgi:hypothetical protein